MSVLPNIPQRFVKRLNEKRMTFFGIQGSQKIKLTVLQQPKNNGGLGSVDFQLKDRALKSSWVKQIHEDELIKNCAYKALDNPTGDVLRECNIEANMIRRTFKPSFWRDILESWSYYNFQTPIKPSEIVNQVIWFNSHILVKNAPLFYQKAFESGLIYVGQLFNADGGPLASELITNMFDLSIIQRNSILSAMPKEWKRMLSVEIQIQNIESRYEQFIKTKKLVKEYYDKLIIELSMLNNLYEKWLRQIEVAFDYEEFVSSFVNINLNTNQAKLKSFQYRLLHNALILNDRLFHWKIVSNPYCKYCINEQKETIFHFLWTCHRAQTLWHWVEKNM